MHGFGGFRPSFCRAETQHDAVLGSSGSSSQRLGVGEDKTEAGATQKCRMQKPCLVNRREKINVQCPRCHFPVRPRARAQCDAIAILNRGLGAVYLAGRCCGSGIQLAWICARSARSLTQPQPCSSPHPFPCETPAAQRASYHVKKKACRFPALIHIWRQTDGLDWLRPKGMPCYRRASFPEPLDQERLTLHSLQRTDIPPDLPLTIFAQSSTRTVWGPGISYVTFVFNLGIVCQSMMASTWPLRKSDAIASTRQTF
jgi:hypothetical protein